MSMQFYEIIRVLREAHDWTSCRENLTTLAHNLTEADVINIVLAMARQFLSQCVEDMPDEPKVRAAIAALTNINVMEELLIGSQEIRSLLQDKAGTPGINTYRNAMREIEQLAKFDGGSKEAAGAFVDITSALVLAIEDYRWGTEHRELWQRAFEHRDREDFFIRANHFVVDPKVVALNKSLWNQLADAIEKALK